MTTTGLPADRVSERIEVRGVVQGVGFRPFVHRLASGLGLDGRVANDSARVVIDVAGPPTAIDQLIDRLSSEAPPLAHVTELCRGPAAGPVPGGGFRIDHSDAGAGPRTLVPPDTAVCHDCLAELFDPADRRYLHPFITCTNCGPRYTIITDLPYDRPHTTMAGFPMCEACQSEYSDPADRRYHAQPIACPDCGPVLSFRTAKGSGDDDDPIAAARRTLTAGAVLALKGLGGYHLVCDATDPRAVAGLRRRKHRPDKPFAVMAATTDEVRHLAHLGPAEVDQLDGPARPIVLLRALERSPVADEVAPGNPLIGVMLPYTPIHHLLFEGGLPPLVVTSANLAGEPLAHRDEQIEPLLGPVADAVLDHDRPIHVPCDDSVVRVVGDALLPVRRARGFAPIPVALGTASRSVVAVGGELKNTVCVSSAEHAWVSQHIGDMGTLATLGTHNHLTEHLGQLFAVEPERWAVDSHPGYVTSRQARRLHPDAIVEVQHHHAHVAAVMAEHGLDPDTPVVGFAFDGTGYGPDGAVWGGEVLRASAHGYERLAHLAPVMLTGGDAAVDNPCRTALAHLHAAGVEWDGHLAPVAQFATFEQDILRRQLEGGFGCTPTTSMGRLFDAVASLLGVRHRITYEAQAAIELENAAIRHDELGGPACSYHFAWSPAGEPGPRVFDAAPVIRAMVADVGDGLPVESIAAGFHTAVVDLVAGLALDLVADHDPVVVLSGGVFQNAFLLGRIVERLDAAGRLALVHHIVPPNDGGLALGQAFVAAHHRSSEDPEEN